METNRIYCCDVLDGLRKLGNGTIDLIITPPPYNKAGFNGKKKRDKWSIWNKTIDYSGDIDIDCMDENTYEQWQVEVLNECYRVLKDDGSMFYNHKVRVRNNQVSHPIQWISRSSFNCRQIITWDKGASPNLDNCRYIPTTELIFWLNKTSKNPRFKRDGCTKFPNEVWRFPSDKSTQHPAPFHVALPDNIIPSVAMGERIVVLDPFMGSGTVAISALKNGCDYIGFELSDKYVRLANHKLDEFNNKNKTNNHAVSNTEQL